MAMNSSSDECLSWTEIIKEAFKLTRKNKKTFLLIALSAAILLPLLSMASILSNLSLTNEVTGELISLLNMDPKTPEYRNMLLKIKEDAIVFIVVTIVLQLFTLAFSLCATVAITYTSAVSYLGKDLSLMDIYSKLRKIWLRPVITFFCSCLVTGGYALMLLPLVLYMYLGKGIVIVVAVGVVLIVAALIMSCYLSSVLVLGFVSSILEDCCGLQALGKGQKLLEGRKTVGVLLPLIMSIFVSSIYPVGLYLPFIMSVFVGPVYPLTKYHLLITYVLIVYLVLVSMLNAMVYTVFYFECKKGNGEEAEINAAAEDMGEYTRLSTAPMDGSDFA